MLKALTLNLFLCSGALAQQRINQKPGLCPHAPGSLQSEMRTGDGAKMGGLMGAWMTVVHDKSVAGQMTCIGSQYSPIEGKDGIIQLSKSSGFTDSMKKQLVEM